MVQRNKSEKGQAIILIAFAIMGTLALVGLAIDGGQTFSDRRKVQNAADAAALAEALTYRENVDKGRAPFINVKTNAQNAAATNGYTDGVNSNIQLDDPVPSPAGTCPGSDEGQDFTVTITSTVKTSFAPVVGVNELQNTVTATARTCAFIYQPFVLGNAIVGTNPGPDCAFDSDTGNAGWKVHGGGIFANGCAKAKGNVTFDPGFCASAPNDANVTGFPCAAPGPVFKFPDDFAEMMPPNPCGATPLPAPDNNRYFPADPPKNGSVTYENGIYCVSDFDAYDKVDITLHNATIYVTDTSFKLQFAGSGGFDGYSSREGRFAGMFLVVAMSNTPCPRFTSNTTQNFVFRGNGKADIDGSIWAPTACVDFRGNSNSKNMNSQLIGYNVTANGTADVEITYNQKSTQQQVLPSTVELVK